MGGGCSSVNDASEKRNQVVRLVDEQLGFCRRVLVDLGERTGLAPAYGQALAEMVPRTLEKLCQESALSETLQELQELEAELLDTKLHTADPLQIDLPKLLRLIIKTIGEGTFLQEVRPLIIPPLLDLTAALHDSGASDGASLHFLESVCFNAMECVLTSGFLPLRLAVSELQIAIESKDPVAIRQGLQKFAMVVMCDDAAEVAELHRQAVAACLEPVLELCVEEFDVFGRFLSMLCISADVAYRKGTADWLHFVSVTSQLHKCKNMGEAQDRIKWIAAQIVGIKVVEKLISDTAIEDSLTKARGLKLDPLDLKLLDAIQQHCTKHVVNNEMADILEKLDGLEKLRKPGAQPKAIHAIAVEVCGERVVDTITKQTNIAFFESAPGIIRKWNVRTKNSKKNPKFVHAQSIALIAAAARVSVRKRRPEVANSLLRIPNLARADQVEEEITNAAMAVLGEDRYDELKMKYGLEDKAKKFGVQDEFAPVEMTVMGQQAEVHKALKDHFASDHHFDLLDLCCTQSLDPGLEESLDVALELSQISSEDLGKNKGGIAKTGLATMKEKLETLAVVLVKEDGYCRWQAHHNRKALRKALEKADRVMNQYCVDHHSKELLRQVTLNIENKVIVGGRLLDAKNRADVLGNSTEEGVDEALTNLGTTVLGERIVAALKLQAVEHSMPRCEETVESHNMGASAITILSTINKATKEGSWLHRGPRAAPTTIDLVLLPASLVAKDFAYKLMETNSDHWFKGSDEVANTSDEQLERAWECLDTLAGAMLGDRGYNELKLLLIKQAMQECREKMAEMQMISDAMELYSEAVKFVEGSTILPLDQLTTIKGLVEELALYQENEEILGLELDADGNEKPSMQIQILQAKIAEAVDDQAKEAAELEMEQQIEQDAVERLEKLQSGRREEMLSKVTTIEALVIELLGEAFLVATQMQQTSRALSEDCEPVLREQLSWDVCELVLALASTFASGTPRRLMIKDRKGLLKPVDEIREILFGQWPKPRPETWDKLLVYNEIDRLALSVLGEWTLAEHKVASLATEVRENCALALERNLMDDYAMDLLIELRVALDKDGDGGIDTKEVVEVMHANGTIQDMAHPVAALAVAHLAMHALLLSQTGDEADTHLDAFATSLLGKETVAELKVKAITEAMQKCAKLLERRGFGPDCPMLFDAACKALDSDGDGQIDAEEFKALECAKGQVDQILKSDPTHKRHNPERDTIPIAIEALDVMAIALLGEQQVGELKITAIANAMNHIKEVLQQPEYPADCVDLFICSCDALDADGDGQIDAEEFRAIKFAKAHMDVILDKESEAMERILSLDKMAVCLLGPEDVATIKLKVIFDNLTECATVLEKLEMDHYSVSLLQDTVAMLDGDGDGDIEADEFQKALAAQGRIVEGEALLQPVADAKLAVDRLLHCQTDDEGYIELDAMAVQLLGQDIVGELKMKAIKAAAEECSRIISAFHLGKDAIELFDEAFNSLDRDGDGKIDAEEFAAIADAKREMDNLLRATTKEEVSRALDGVALGLIGPEAVALLKVKAIADLIDRCVEKMTDHHLDPDHFELLDAVRVYSDRAKNSKFTDAATALDQDGDGDVSHAEFLAAQSACNSCHLLLASNDPEDCALHLEAMSLGLLGEERYAEKRQGQIRESIAAISEMGKAQDCGQYLEDLLQTFDTNTVECTDMLELPQRATVMKKLVKDVEGATSWTECFVLVDAVMQFWLSSIVFAQIKVAAIVAGLPKCELKLEECGMDQYSFRLLADMCYAVDADGDGDIDCEEIRATLEKASGGTITGASELLRAVTSAKRAMETFLASTGQEDVEETLDLFAEELLGKLVVAQLKVAAILDALRRCKEVLRELNFGDDALELFEESCKALDEDGDGEIAPEEFKAVTSAKSDVDAILNAEDERSASEALDKMAETLLGYDRLAQYKLDAIQRLLPLIREHIKEFSLDKETQTLMAIVAKLLETKSTQLDKAVEAKETAVQLAAADSAEANISLLDELSVALAGDRLVRDHKSRAIEAAINAVLLHSEGVETVGHLIVPSTVAALLEEIRVNAANNTTIPEMTKIKEVIQELLKLDHVADLLVDVDAITAQYHGEKRVAAIKTECCKAMLFECATELKRSRVSKDQFALFEEAKGAILKYTTLLEHSWGAATSILSVCQANDTSSQNHDEDDEVISPGLEAVSVALETFVTAILGPPEERRAPHSRCAPTIRIQRPARPQRQKLTSVMSNSIEKVKMTALMATKFSNEAKWQAEEGIVESTD